MLEKLESVGQADTGDSARSDDPLLDRLEQVVAIMARNPWLFREQGAVVPTWRYTAKRKLGPYYELRYRESGRQRVIYLGRSKELAEMMTEVLRRWQLTHKQELLLRQTRSQVAKALRRQKLALEQQLQLELGLSLQGYEVRGAGQVTN